MTIFSVVPLGRGRERLEESIKKLPKSDVYELGGGAGWLVKFTGTALELCATLGLPTKREQLGEDGTPPTVLVSGMTGYYGFGPRDMWEWVRSREGA